MPAKDPPEWQETGWADDGPTYRHTPCGGTITTRRSNPYGALDQALCHDCHTYWTRPNARFSWRVKQRRGEPP